jgi:hypothetical protein
LRISGIIHALISYFLRIFVLFFKPSVFAFPLVSAGPTDGRSAGGVDRPRVAGGGTP